MLALYRVEMIDTAGNFSVQRFELSSSANFYFNNRVNAAGPWGYREIRLIGASNNVVRSWKKGRQE